MADEIPTLNSYCLCTDRHVAMQEALFVYLYDFDGWAFVDDVPRSTTFEKAYHAGSNHNGEPFIWHCCPFCGRDMIAPPPPYAQGDGWEGE